MRRAVVMCLVLVGCAADTAGVPGDDDTDGGNGLDEAPSLGAIPEASTPLADMIEWIDAELPARTPGTQLSLTIERLATGERWSLRGATKHVSASSAKAWWVAAALDAVGIAPVMPYADPIFRNSDNSAAGSVIDLVGPNAVNTWMWNVGGMNDSALTQWNFDKTRVATNSPRAMGGDNYMTTDDAVTFLARVWRKEILAGAEGNALLQWMTLSPNTGLAGMLLAQLPASAKASGMHKAGYLPPGCCSSDAYYNTSNDIGIIKTPGGEAYAIAILARRGTDYYGKQVPFVQLSSCVMYRSFVGDDAVVCE